VKPKRFKTFSYKLKTYFLFLILLNTVSVFSIVLILLDSVPYSLRGDVSIWILTILINGISPIIFWLLMIIEAFKKHPNKSYNKAFLISLLSYPIAFFIFVISVFHINLLVCETDIYVSPSSQKSISIVITSFEGKESGMLRVKEFLFNKEIETTINLPIDWFESYKKTTLPLESSKHREGNLQLCDNYKEKTEVKWLDNENQIQIKTKSNKGSQVQIINLTSFDNNLKIPKVFV
jgi:hypothetical protein